MNKESLFEKPWATSVSLADFSILASEGGDKKPPKGFEKFFKGNKKASTDNENEDNKEDKEKAQKDQDDELSEEEDAQETASKETEVEDDRN
jgi:hypothetical protein